MTDAPEQTPLTDYRVMFRHFAPDAAGPSFLFTTVLAQTADDAAAQLSAAHASDRNFEVIQVEPSNGVETAYTYADIKAQRTPQEVKAEARREGILQLVHLANAEEAGTLREAFGTGWTDLVDQWMAEAIISLQAAGLLPQEAHDAE